MKRMCMAISFLALSACMVGPDYERPQLPIAEDWHVDLSYKSDDPESLAEQAWIDIFADEQLRSLIQQALEQNKQMLLAIERIEEAKALYGINRAALFPTVNLDLTAEREDESSLTNTNAQTTDEFFLGPTVKWEIDLWGKNRRASDAAYARYLASEYGAKAVRLSLIAEVCRAYFLLAGTNARLAINNETVDSRESSLVIATKRFNGGLTSKLEVKQAEVELASSRSFVPKVERDRVVAENQLSVLMGLPPQHLVLTTSLEQQHIPKKVTAGIPSSLLRRRPDILRSEQELIAASEGVGVAEAGLFPNITLTGGLGYETEDFGDLLDSDGEYWIADLDIAMPLFNAGARRAQLSAAESRFNQARLAYEQAVLEALREVSDALNTFYKTGESLEAELALQKASSEYVSLATKRYRNGVLAYLDVLDAQRFQFGAEIAVSVARQAQLTALVDLYKALGGGWNPDIIGTQEGAL